MPNYIELDIKYWKDEIMLKKPEEVTNFHVDVASKFDWEMAHDTLNVLKCEF